jgi:hypothetical protein
MKLSLVWLVAGAVLGGCVFSQSSDPIHVIRPSDWQQFDKKCVGVGGLLRLETFTQPELLVKAVCGNDLKSGRVSRRVHAIYPSEWSLAKERCVGYGGLLQIETFVRPGKSLKAVCRSGAVFPIAESE